MSEEILKALMQLFALIAKQDGGIGQKEIDYVRRFLVQQIGVDSATDYLQLFKDTAELDSIPIKAVDPETDSGGGKEPGTAPKKKLTSVLDSVRVLKLCKQISKTINQRQKVVVLVRILELINAEYPLTEQRLGIVKTVSDIFRISKEEYGSIFTFVTSREDADFSGPNHMIMYPLFFLRIPSVGLYFVKFSGQMEVFLNGLSMHNGSIYLFASGSTLRLPVGLPVYYSDISSRFQSDRAPEKITLEADHLSYQFSDETQGLKDITFNARQGNLVGIMGSSGTGKTTLMNVLAGMYTPSSGQVRINQLALHKDAG